MTVRSVIGFVVGWALALGLLALICLVGFMMWIGPIGPSKDPEQRRALDRYFHGHELYDAGEYEKAAHEYMAWEHWQETHGEDSSEVKGLIGHCLDLAGHPDEGLKRLDQSLAMNRRWYRCIDKATFLARHESPRAALAWLEGLDFEPETREHMLGTYHKDRAEFAAALPHLQEWFELAKGRAFTFGSDDQIEIAGAAVEGKASGVGCLLDPLEDLAETHMALGNVEESHRHATMGISVGRLISADARPYAGERYADAGSVRCRIVRAEVEMKRRHWDEARDEIDYAAAYADWAKYPGHVKAVAKARAELAEAMRR